MHFTSEQLQAINSHGRNILVAAAAGSGKTRVLVERIVQGIIKGQENYEIDKLLIVTFTRAAADEMRMRIGRALADELEKAQKASDTKLMMHLDRQIVLLSSASISTFDSFCQQILRQNIEVTGLDPKFRLVGTEAEIELIKREVLEDTFIECYDEPQRENFTDETMFKRALGERDDFIALADAYGNDKGDEKLAEAVLSLYEFSQSQPVPDKWLEEQALLYDLPHDSKLIDTHWSCTMWQEIDKAKDKLKEALEKMAYFLAFDALKGLAITEQEKADSELEPYRVLMQSTTYAAVDNILDKGHNWNLLREAVFSFKAGALRGKSYKPLKDDFPLLREAFEEHHNAIKACVKSLKEDYLSLTEEELIAELNEGMATIKAYITLTLKFMNNFTKVKLERNILDFSDLEHLVIALLCADTEALMEKPPRYIPSEIALSLKKHYAEILVDEYQDTNSVQEAIINLLQSDTNCFMVGDIKQSIYRFRLANPALFQQKYDTYPSSPQADDKYQLITMRKNFRSRLGVIAPINFIFSQIMQRASMEIDYDEQARLYLGADYPDVEGCTQNGLELDLVLDEGKENTALEEKNIESKDANAKEDLVGFELEAEYIAERIASLLAEKPLVFVDGTYRQLEARDIAVLLRSIKGRGNILLEALRRHNIPAYAESSSGYFEAVEIKLMLSVLAIIDNARQDIPLAAVMASPIGGFTLAELAQIRLAAPQEDLFEALIASANGALASIPKTKNLIARLQKFTSQLEAWRDYALMHSVDELIWCIYHDTGYYDYVGALKGGLLRQANLRMLADRARVYEKSNYRGLFRFRRFMESLKKKDTDLSVARTLGESENVVRIMTIHKSKGLEFPVVILADTGKQFNMRSISNSLFLFHQELGIGAQLVQTLGLLRQRYHTWVWELIAHILRSEARAEEMRILYVALTRSREKLIITGNVKAKDLEKSIARWQKVVLASKENTALNSAEVAGANCYLDWLVPAIARHSEEGKLKALLNIHDMDMPLLESQKDAHFIVNIINKNDVAKKTVETNTINSLLDAIRKKNSLPPREYAEYVDATLSWEYPDLGLKQVASKLTVTDIKRRFTSVVPDVGQMLMPGNPLNIVSSVKEEFKSPKLLSTEAISKKRRFTASERGTIMHSVLQYLDINEATYDVKTQLQEMVKQGFLQQEELETVDMKKIMRFLESDLAQKIRQAKCVYRELSFSILLPAKEFYPEVKENSSQIFVQGVIDVLLQEKDSFSIIDYKTDRNITTSEALRRYHIQLSLYARAISEIIHCKKPKAYIYMIERNELVEVV